MSPDIYTLGQALPREIERCQELLCAYAEIGPAGNFGALMIKTAIATALKALAEQDVAQMIRSYEELKQCQ